MLNFGSKRLKTIQPPVDQVGGLEMRMNQMELSADIHTDNDFSKFVRTLPSVRPVDVGGPRSVVVLVLDLEPSRSIRMPEIVRHLRALSEALPHGSALNVMMASVAEGSWAIIGHPRSGDNFERAVQAARRKQCYARDLLDMSIRTFVTTACLLHNPLVVVALVGQQPPHFVQSSEGALLRRATNYLRDCATSTPIFVCGDVSLWPSHGALFPGDIHLEPELCHVLPRMLAAIFTGEFLAMRQQRLLLLLSATEVFVHERHTMLIENTRGTKLSVDCMMIICEYWCPGQPLCEDVPSVWCEDSETILGCPFASTLQLEDSLAELMARLNTSVCGTETRIAAARAGLALGGDLSMQFDSDRNLHSNPTVSISIATVLPISVTADGPQDLLQAGFAAIVGTNFCIAWHEERMRWQLFDNTLDSDTFQISIFDKVATYFPKVCGLH